MWCPNPDDNFLSQSGIHSFPPPQMYSSCRSLRFIFSKPFEYLYHQGQCYISDCTFLLIRNPAEGCAKPYAFICRWHFYFHWMMRCPPFLILFPLKWQVWSSDLMSTFSFLRLDKKGIGFVFLSLFKISLLHNMSHYIFVSKRCATLRWNYWCFLQVFTGLPRCCVHLVDTLMLFKRLGSISSSCRLSYKPSDLTKE